MLALLSDWARKVKEGIKMNIFEIIAEKRIQEAIDNGEFDNLPGKGKPLYLEDLSGVAPEDRMANKILKNAGVLPPRMALRKEICDLKNNISESTSEEEKAELLKKLCEKMTAYEVMKEKMMRRY